MNEANGVERQTQGTLPIFSVSERLGNSERNKNAGSRTEQQQ